MHSLTFTPGFIQKTTFLLLSRPPWSISACKQVELAPGSSRTTQNSLVSHSCQNVLTNKAKFKNQFLLEIIFQYCTIFYMHMYTSSKVTHTKYAVAETRISSVRWITVIHVLRLFLQPLLTMYFCIEFQDFKLMQYHVRCQKWMKTGNRPSLMMSTLPGCTLTLDQ